MGNATALHRIKPQFISVGMLTTTNNYLAFCNSHTNMDSMWTPGERKSIKDDGFNKLMSTSLKSCQEKRWKRLLGMKGCKMGEEGWQVPHHTRAGGVCWPLIYLFVKLVLISINQINYSKHRTLRSLPKKLCSILKSCTTEEMPCSQQQHHILLSHCNSYFCRGWIYTPLTLQSQ